MTRHVATFFFLYILSSSLFANPSGLGQTEKDIQKVSGAAMQDAKQQANSFMSWLKAYKNRLETTVKTEWRHLSDADIATGESKKDNDEKPQWERLAVSAKNNAVSAIIAAATALSALYGYEVLFPTDSRRRNKKIVTALTLLSAWYGCGVQQRASMANCPTTAAAVRDRLTLLVVSSGLITLLISIIQYWDKKQDKNVHPDDKKQPRAPKFRQHMLWAAEVAMTQMIAATLGYQFNRYRMR